MVLLLGCFFAMAQNSTQGKEFWFSYMENGYKYNGTAWVDNTVMVSAKRACTGTIAKPDGSLPEIPFSVGANGITIIDIPEEYAYNEDNSEVVDSRSLVLRATDTVSVYISNIATYSFDASFVLPVESLGSEYIIQCFEQENGESPLNNNILTTAFLIIAVEDNTLVDIIPNIETEHNLVFPGATTTITLNAGETFFVRSNFIESWRDLSGSIVMAHDDKKIAVFNGNTTTCIPTDVGNGRDHIFEQALPTVRRDYFAGTCPRLREDYLGRRRQRRDAQWATPCHAAQRAVLCVRLALVKRLVFHRDYATQRGVSLQHHGTGVF